MAPTTAIFSVSRVIVAVCEASRSSRLMPVSESKVPRVG